MTPYCVLHVQADATQAAAFIYALAVFQQPPGDEWLAAFCSRTQQLLTETDSEPTSSRTSTSNIPASVLSRCLWSLACLGYRPPAKWLQLVTAEVEAAAADLSAVEVADAVWGMVKLRAVVKDGMLNTLVIKSQVRL